MLKIITAPFVYINFTGSNSAGFPVILCQKFTIEPKNIFKIPLSPRIVIHAKILMSEFVKNGMIIRIKSNV